MKLILQSDDFGISEAVTCGIIKGIRDGLITSTGMFANMPSSEFAARVIRDYPQVCLGEDINLVAGKPCSRPEKIPSLVQEDGSFKTSGMHRQEDVRDGNQDHVKYEECLIEAEAQIQRFMELNGKKPEYLQGHSYSTPAVIRAMKELGEKYGIPVIRQLTEEGRIRRIASEWNKKPFRLEDQAAADPLSCIMNIPVWDDPVPGLLVTHCGYVDDTLMHVSTYTLVRTKDLAAVSSEQLKQWVKEKGIQLISYRDL